MSPSVMTFTGRDCPPVPAGPLSRPRRLQKPTALRRRDPPRARLLPTLPMGSAASLGDG